MKIFFLVLFLLSSFGFSETSDEPIPKSITIGLIPGGNPEAIKKQSVALGEKIQKALNIPVQIFISKNYNGLVDAVKNKKVDYAFLSALTYVQAENDVSLKVLLKKTWSGPYYYSAIVALKKSSIRNISDFKNKKIAFVDTGSTSGYLYPQVYLQKNKINDQTFKQVVISGSHASSVEKLQSGEVDLIAVFADDDKGLHGAWNRFSKNKLPQNKKSEFQVLWVSDPIPNDPIVVRTEFYNQYPKLTHELMSSLIDIQSDDINIKSISEIMGQGALMPATARQYDPVREMNKTLKIK
jgi:phosphonate transport system substrate-binding protein